MIEILNLTKRFQDTEALKDVSMRIRDGEVFGLIGTNGAGKSTLLRLIAGVLRADNGAVCIDKAYVYDNPDAKKEVFFLSDDAHFFMNATPEDMMRYYALYYPGFDREKFSNLLAGFRLDPKKRISAFSKGMKKQLLISLGLSASTRYLLCDETFDGLDPVARQGVKSLFAMEMEDRGLTPVIASHSLRELEDISDHIGLLHQGGVLLSENIGEMKLNIQRIQAVFEEDFDADAMLRDMDVVKHDVRGRMHTITVRGSREDAARKFAEAQPVFMEFLDLTLEEIFISETEVAGYDFRQFLLD